MPFCQSSYKVRRTLRRELEIFFNGLIRSISRPLKIVQRSTRSIADSRNFVEETSTKSKLSDRHHKNAVSVKCVTRPTGSDVVESCSIECFRGHKSTRMSRTV